MYTRYTTDISAEAKALRDTLQEAREPQPLLLRDLPAALGFQDIDERDQVTDYFDTIRRVLTELQGAYGHLLQSIRRQLYDALYLPDDDPQARQEIAQRCGLLAPWAAELRMKAFVQRLQNEEHNQRKWLESVAALVNNKTPDKWNDQDVIKFQVALYRIVEEFQAIETLASSRQTTEPASTENNRLSISSTDRQETRIALQVRNAPLDAEDARFTRSMCTFLDRRSRDVQLRILAQLAIELGGTDTPVNEGDVS